MNTVPETAVNISVEQYENSEISARCRLSYAEVSAFASTTFEIMGYPARIRREQELAGFVDWNFSPSNRQYFIRNHFVPGPSVRTAFSRKEKEAIGRVCDGTAAMTRSCFGREMRPISSLLAQVGLYRVVQALRTVYGMEDIRVFETGPGNGYLGALLIDAGCHYSATDNAASLYLWQSRLFGHLASERFAEWGACGAPPELDAFRVHHLPWWDYVGLRHREDARADVFISNTNLGEMNYGALLYTIRIARKLLADSPMGLFVFTNIGDAKQNTMATVEGEFARTGFQRVCNRSFHAFARPGARIPAELAALDEDIPLYNPSGEPARFDTVDVISTDPATHPSDLDFITFLDVFTPPREMLES